MARKRTSIVRWTGRGKLSDLRSSVNFVVTKQHPKAKVRIVGRSLLVEGPEPLGVSTRLEGMPGVDWVAAGEQGRSLADLAGTAAILARKYVHRGDRFAVDGEGAGRGVASDLVGAITSTVLESVKGAKVAMQNPKTRFRAVLDEDGGAVGVEVARGPGGTPTGKESATCLVSGGRHGAVLAWYALLAGKKVTLVHAKVSDESERAVTRLYSELSNRADPRGIELKVITGGPVGGLVAWAIKRSRGDVFAGFHVGVAAPPKKTLHRVSSPLYLLSEEGFGSAFESLGVRAHDGVADWEAKGDIQPQLFSFGGREADVSAVLDGLRRNSAS